MTTHAYLPRIDEDDEEEMEEQALNLQTLVTTPEQIPTSPPQAVAIEINASLNERDQGSTDTFIMVDMGCDNYDEGIASSDGSRLTSNSNSLGDCSDENAASGSDEASSLYLQETATERAMKRKFDSLREQDFAGRCTQTINSGKSLAESSHSLGEQTDEGVTSSNSSECVIPDSLQTARRDDGSEEEGGGKGTADNSKFRSADSPQRSSDECNSIEAQERAYQALL